MQDHCNGHRCHGDRFSMYEKCSHRQDLHSRGMGLPSSVFYLAGQDRQAHRRRIVRLGDLRERKKRPHLVENQTLKSLKEPFK